SMALGASLGFMGIGIAGIEIMIALGLVIMGFLLLTDQSMRMGMAIAFIAVIAMAHGFAHGVELIGQPYIASLVGMLLATTALHILGYLTGSLQGALASRLYEAFAAVMLVTGGLFFVN
ncbi:MAG TPA: HupE/UreJ family protein, partial [Methylophilaceae bacterium]|nr:HupE/UreJ family protein [Methylophilaceae bacterium]